MHVLKFRRYDGVSDEAVDETRSFAFYNIFPNTVLHLRPAALGLPPLSRGFVFAMEQDAACANIEAMFPELAELKVKPDNDAHKEEPDDDEYVDFGNGDEDFYNDDENVIIYHA